MATTPQRKKEVSDTNQAPLWTYGQAAAKRAEEQSSDVLTEWEAFKDNLEHIEVGDTEEEETDE